MGKLKSLLLVITVFLSCFSCAGTNDFDDVLKDRQSIIGKEIKLVGVIRNQDGRKLICSDYDSDNCLDLQFTVDQASRINEFEGYRVELNGVYREHEYLDKDGALRFIPSRILVLMVKKIP
ncbi:hypothetical protein ACFO4O_14685 [Glaciecola siphonariae]|uniref:Lipoprotein n=1 Tax=Glaciecola siphonariae TaxID=521012 RepID=A0ABV9LXX2_9ALTE